MRYPNRQELSEIRNDHELHYLALYCLLLATGPGIKVSGDHQKFVDDLRGECMKRAEEIFNRYQ